jgi:hypothetical protein
MNVYGIFTVGVFHLNYSEFIFYRRNPYAYCNRNKKRHPKTRKKLAAFTACDFGDIHRPCRRTLKLQNLRTSPRRRGDTSFNASDLPFIA